MTENAKKRGRPKGSGSHQQSDARLLPVIADRRLNNEHLPLAAIIRDLIDTGRDTGGIRRLQRAFRAQGETLMTAARSRRQERQWREVAERIDAFADGFRRVRNTVFDKWEAWARSPEGQRAEELMRRFSEAANSPEARKWAALASRLQQSTLGDPYRLIGR